MEKSRKELEKKCAAAEAKVEQYQHEGQRLENRIKYYQQGDRKRRNHRLITRGAAVESIVPEVRGMSERALGIKDNVEDIAAAFKKMAIINPNKTRRPPQSRAIPIPVEDQPAIMELPASAAAEIPKIKTADAEQKHALYEGLLAKTIEERKKKKSRKEVDENQLSFFDFVA